MSRLKTLLSSGGALALVGSAFIGAPAIADTNSDDLSADAQGYVEFLENYGVEPSTALALAEAFDDGQLSDAMTGASAPVGTRTLELDGHHVVVTEYPDGSVSQTTYEQPDTTATAPMSISGCNVSTGSGYSLATNCAIDGSNWLVGMRFYADYQNVNGAFDSILSTYAPSATCLATCDTPERAFFRSTETATNFATATYNMRYTYGPIGTNTAGLQLDVGNDSAYTTFTP